MAMKCQGIKTYKKPPKDIQNIFKNQSGMVFSYRGLQWKNFLDFLPRAPEPISKGWWDMAGLPLLGTVHFRECRLNLKHLLQLHPGLGSSGFVWNDGFVDMDKIGNLKIGCVGLKAGIIWPKSDGFIYITYDQIWWFPMCLEQWPIATPKTSKNSWKRQPHSRA
jgi:hypothetical protein